VKRINRKLVGTILAVAAVIAILVASPALPFTKKPLLSEPYGKVVVQYYPKGSGIELEVSTDKGVLGYVANAYIAVPYANFQVPWGLGLKGR
jgi:hypothetical protein